MAATNLPFIQQQIIIYGMTVCFILGLVGNICNCIMFTRRSYRHTPSSIYFLSLSFLAIIYLLWSTIPNIYTLDHIDPQRYSLFYCKMRSYISHVLGLGNRYIMVFACVDRFFATQKNVRIRSLSSVRLATKLVCTIGPVLLVVAVHLAILSDIRGGTCTIFGVYKLIYAVYQIIVAAIIPPTLMAVFSILAIRSLNQRHGNQVHVKQRDRYLMRMVIAEVIVIIFTSIPYSAYVVYGAVTYHIVNKSAERLEIESFLNFISQFIIYLFNVTPFYLFMLTSKPFRNEFINLSIKFWYKYLLRRMRIVPLNTQNNITTMNS